MGHDGISIDDADVAFAARALACRFDTEHVRVLKLLQSADISAAPGSGKTTLLAAKLLILAQKWTSRDGGILVVSHTNVARDEVMRRLTSDAAGTRLTRHPHFIGTIQSFIDRFLAFPYLREVGVGNVKIRNPRVDDDAFATRAKDLFGGRAGWKDYPKARGHYAKKEGAGEAVVSTLFYAGGGQELCSGEKIPRPESPTSQQLRALKDKVSAEGIFRYADMFSFAEAIIDLHPFLLDALRRRFRWVFVDEMQDTEQHQESLLNRIFWSHSVMQRFGDRNQGIYRATPHQTGSYLASTGVAVEVTVSQRFGHAIAGFASRLTTETMREIRGNPARKDREHTIFLFDNKSILSVLPAFGDLILREWRTGLPSSFVAKAVGFRKQGDSQPNNLPYTIADYWQEYRADTSDEHVRRRFVCVLQGARNLVDAQQETRAAYRLLLEGLAEIVSRHEGSRVSHSDLLERARMGQLDGEAVGSLLTDLCLGRIRGTLTISSRNWDEVVRRTRAALDLGDESQTSESCLDYMAWEAVPVVARNRLLNPLTNAYPHRSDRGSVDIQVSTIHGVKGETHDATLLLETMNHEHDLLHVVPFLAGVGNLADINKKVRLPRHLKLAFVAVTRPRELVCLALRRDHVLDEHIPLLERAGWRVSDLTQPPNGSSKAGHGFSGSDGAS